LVLVPFFLLVDSFPGFSRSPFEKPQVVACGFLKEFWANLINLSTNRIRGKIAICCLQKTAARGFGVKGTVSRDFLINFLF
jgi:hypothetical protein